MSWDRLSMAEKAEVMRLAVRDGIYDLDAIRNGYNEFAKGGKIYIKPSHRGRLTELKKRTGKTEAELYNDGNPAHKKMVVFARNSRKWKHGDGGNLFVDGGDSNPMNYEYRGSILDNELKKQGITHIAELPEVTITGRDPKGYRSAFDGSVQPYIEYFGALSHGLQPLSLSQHVGAAADAIQGKRNYFDSLFNGNSGFFTDAYAAEHPWVSTLGNMAGDVLIPASPYIAKSASAFASAAKANQGFALSTPYMGKSLGKMTVWVPTDRNPLKGISWMSTGKPVEEGLPLNYITSKYSGEGRKLYDVGINLVHKQGSSGLLVGDNLMSAPKSYSTYEHYYPNRVHVDDQGYWTNRNMLPDPEMRGRAVYSLEDFLKETREHPTEKITFPGAPRYRLETPSTKNTKHSFLDGTDEKTMYYRFEDGLRDWDLIRKDTEKGIADAVDYLGSDIKAASDAHNIELARRIGFKNFSPYTKAQERASVPISPEYKEGIIIDGENVGGYVERNVDNAASDKMQININYDADKSGLHETLHRGYLGEYYPEEYNPEAEDVMDYLLKEPDTKRFYDFKTDKLLAARTSENAKLFDYLKEEGEAATNIMELGRRMGIKPGDSWPGKKKAIELFQKFSESRDPKTPIFNVYNWKQRPKRVWDAAAGKYFTIGSGITTATIANKND